MNKKAPTLLFLLAALLGPGPARSDDPPAEPELRLLPTCRVCHDGRELALIYVLLDAPGSEATGGRALVTVTNEQGDEVVAGPGRSLDSRELQDALAALPPGVYRAVARLDGLASNRVTFEIVPEAPAGDLPPLVFEPVVDAAGTPGGRMFLAYLRNTGDGKLSLINAWRSCRLILDGVEHESRAIWVRGGDLSPGEPASLWVNLDDFLDGKPLAPGPHTMQIRLAGHLSVPLAIEASIPNQP